jgi:hypothetical protein
MPHILDLLDQTLKDRYEAKKLEHKRKGFWVSDLSKCLRGVYLERQGVEPKYDARQLRVFRVGDMMEDFVIENLDPLTILEKQGKCEWPEFDLTGRFDVMLQTEDGRVFLKEIKSQNSNAFHYHRKRGKAQDHHIEQVMLYLDFMRKKYPNLNRCEVDYVSKDDLCIEEYSVEYDEKIVDKALAKAGYLKYCWDNKQLPAVPPAIEYDDEHQRYDIGWVAKYCGNHHVCLGDEKWQEKALDRVRELNGGAIKPKNPVLKREQSYQL